jgi:lipopolysaccharide transport system permease protein
MATQIESPPRPPKMQPETLPQEPVSLNQIESVIGPPRGWQLINVRELWHFRELIYFLVWRDVKVRYKQTLLGVAWSVLQPAMMMIVFTVFFSRVADFTDEEVGYPVFVLCGLLPWTFFSTGLVAAGNSVIGSERLITKVYFPRLAMPFASIGSAFVDFCMAMMLLFVVMAVYLVPPGWTVLLVPLILAAIAVAAAGFGTLLAALNVAYRDVRYVIPFMVQLWIFATPAVYLPTPAATPNNWRNTLVALNPLNGLVAAFRAAVLGREIDWVAFAISCVIVAVMFLLGCFYFRRVEDSFADLI